MARGNAAHYLDNCGHGNGIQLGTAYLTVAEPVGREVLISRTLGGNGFIQEFWLGWTDLDHGIQQEFRWKNKERIPLWFT